MHKGRPAAGFRVTLHPQFDIGKVQFSPSGTTDADGKFAIRSYADGDGAPPGDYAVTVEWLVPPPGRKDPDDVAGSMVDRLRGRYADPKKAYWKVTVHEGPNELEPFKID